MKRIGAVLFFLASHITGMATSQTVTVTFVANEGVLLSSRSGKVLIDALFRSYKDFVVPSDSLRQAMEAGRPPFDSVNLALATHWHGDHFEPRPVTAFLRANPGATFLASRQVLDSLARYEPARSLPSRPAGPSTMEPGTRRRLTVNGITIDVPRHFPYRAKPGRPASRVPDRAPTACGSCTWATAGSRTTPSSPSGSIRRAVDVALVPQLAAPETPRPAR
jgi:L-ascorbate metabolism protein UlaG (beta-lactamase superfamily)